MNKKAFTLTELLVALGIIGAIAALTIPSLMKDINKKILTNQIKNTIASIQLLVTDQMVSHHTKTLSDTDFASPSSLLTSTNFEIAKTCSSNEDKDCWGSYRTIYDPMTTSVPYSDANVSVIKLKNGTTIGYKSDSSTLNLPDSVTETALGKFFIDVNGPDDPNIAGRDYFIAYLTKSGRIVGYGGKKEKTDSEGNTERDGDGNPVLINIKCAEEKSVELAANACFENLLGENWSMNY